MKMIILAAGQGTRLRPLTDRKPKCMVEYENKAIIDYILEATNECGIENITLINGYKKEVLEEYLKNENIKFLTNEKYDTTNMVSTLFCAKKFMDDDLIISYADIVYDKQILQKLIESKDDFSVVIDKKWRELWSQRMEEPLDDAETLKIKGGKIVDLGKKPTSYDDIEGQYIGLIKISKRVITKIIEFYNKLDKEKKYDTKDFHNMYMTSFIQLIIDDGLVDVKPVIIEGGWMEVDTLEDLKISLNKYIPINKGHFELDTIERTKEFSKKMATGWQEEYKEYREKWIELPKKRELTEYPLLVDLELSSACNLKCPMCYTITDEFKQKVTRGFMDFELFKKIVDEITGKVFSLRLSLRGEATLHKNFIECIEYAKSKGIKEVSTLTHGGNLNLKYFIKAAEAGIDWITISVDGVDEEYNKIRKPLTFEGTLKRLQDIKKYKDENNLIKPVIKIQGIWPAIRPNPTKYYETLAPLVDLVAYNPLIDYLRKDNEIVYEDNFACPQLYQRVVVGSDGQVMMCSNDEDGEEIIGNAYEETIYDIWHGEKLNKIRDIHNQYDGFKTMKVCKLCYYPRKMIPDEPAKVGDRDIIVENYINRKQEAGE